MLLECHVLFLGLLLGGANVERQGDNQEKFFIDNTAQALIPSVDISRHFIVSVNCKCHCKSHTHL